MNTWTLVLLLLAAGSVHATNYYVHFTAGSDSNTGKSTNAPWKTIGKVNGFTFAAGDVIAFARGEVWSGTTLVCDNNGAVANGITNAITYTAYGAGPNQPRHHQSGGI